MSKKAMINTQQGFLEFSIVIINPDTRSLAHLLPLKNFNERTNHSSIYPFNFTFYLKKKQNKTQIKVLKDDFYVSKEKRRKKKETNKRLLVDNTHRTQQFPHDLLPSAMTTTPRQRIN